MHQTTLFLSRDKENQIKFLGYIKADSLRAMLIGSIFWCCIRIYQRIADRRTRWNIFLVKPIKLRRLKRPIFMTPSRDLETHCDFFVGKLRTICSFLFNYIAPKDCMNLCVTWSKSQNLCLNIEKDMIQQAKKKVCSMF